MNQPPLVCVLAKYLLDATDRVPEAALMDHVRDFYGKLLKTSRLEPEVSLSPERERLPEVVSVLRQWVHAGVLEVGETAHGIEFVLLGRTQLQDTLDCPFRIGLTGHTTRIPPTRRRNRGVQRDDHKSRTVRHQGK